MKDKQTMARIIGVLFLLPMVAYGGGSGLLGSLLDQPDVLSVLGVHQGQFVSGAVLLLINSITVIAIGILVFSVLETWDKRIALGYLSTRILEGLLLLTGLLSLLSVLAMSEVLLISGETSSFSGGAVMIAKKVNFFAYQLAMIVLGVGSIGFCYVLFRSALVPGWLSMLGLAGYPLLAAGAILEMYGYTVGLLLSVPGGLFEVGIGYWLMVKGFTFSPVSDSELNNPFSNSKRS